MEKKMEMILVIAVILVGVSIGIGLMAGHTSDSEKEEWVDRITRSIDNEFTGSVEISEVHGTVSKIGDSRFCSGTCKVTKNDTWHTTDYYSYSFTYEKNGSKWIQTAGYVYKGSAA